MNVPPRRPGRRRFVGAAVLALPLPGARAQPAARGGVLRLVVGFQAGAASDRIARILAKDLARVLDRPVIVENIAGANSARAISRVAAGDASGDTLLFATSAIAHPDNLALAEPLKPVIVASTAPMMLVVRAGVPAYDPAGFARWLPSRRDATYGSGGIGNATHLCAAELVERLGAEATHVPYAGSPAAFADLVGGRIDFMAAGFNASMLQSPHARVLAITTRQRSSLAGMRQLPTIHETILPGFDFSLWQAIYAPPATLPQSILQLNAALREVLADDATQALLADVGAEVVSGTPEDAQRLRVQEVARFRTRLQR